MGIEDLVKEFVVLAAKAVLSKAELEKAKELMRKLKEAGMSNVEISQLSGGKWTPSTVKFYTPGIKPPHPTLWDNTSALLNDLIHTNMDLGDVETAVTVAHDLDPTGVKLGDVVQFLLAADEASVDVESLVNRVKEMTAAGLSVNNIKEVLEAKNQLQAKGLPLDSLPVLVKLASKYGQVQEVLEVVSAYGSLQELKSEITATKDKLDDRKGSLDALKGEVEQTKQKLALMNQPIQAYQAAVKLGFGPKELADLAALADKFGGPKVVLKAFKAYENHSEIMHQVSLAQQKLEGVQSAMNEVETKYSHLKAAVTMCATLLRDYQYGLDAIATILSVAKKYGQPLEVLKAIEARGSLQALDKEKAALEGMVSELKGILQKLQGEHKQALDSLSSLHATALEVGKEVGKLQGELAASNYMQKLMDLIANPGSTGYDNQIANVMQIAVALRKWVSANETKFKSIFSIKSGLESLIKEIGGLA